MLFRAHPTRIFSYGKKAPLSISFIYPRFKGNIHRPNTQKPETTKN